MDLTESIIRMENYPVKDIMRNGKPDGFWKTYYPSGIMKSEGNRTNFLLDSIWVFYNEVGDTLQKVNYIMGKRNGFTIDL